MVLGGANRETVYQADKLKSDLACLCCPHDENFFSTGFKISGGQNFAAVYFILHGLHDKFGRFE